MLTALVVLGVVVVVGYAVSPWAVAEMDGRPMTPLERERLSWGGLALALGLFLVALFLIGV